MSVGGSRRSCRATLALRPVVEPRPARAGPLQDRPSAPGAGTDPVRPSRNALALSASRRTVPSLLSGDFSDGTPRPYGSSSRSSRTLADGARVLQDRSPHDRKAPGPRKALDVAIGCLSRSAFTIFAEEVKFEACSIPATVV